MLSGTLFFETPAAVAVTCGTAAEAPAPQDEVEPGASSGRSKPCQKPALLLGSGRLSRPVSRRVQL
jgi:hypothetical protein